MENWAEWNNAFVDIFCSFWLKNRLVQFDPVTTRHPVYFEKIQCLLWYILVQNALGPCSVIHKSNKYQPKTKQISI